MKKILLFLVFCSKMVLAQSVIGTWSGDLKAGSVSLPLVFHISEKEGVLSSVMDSPKQNANGIPVNETKFENNQLLLVISGGGIKYQGTQINADSISGTFTQNGSSFPLGLKRGAYKKIERNRPQTPKAPFNYFTEDVSFQNPTEGNTLAGTIAAPSDKKNYPIYVLITGSGQQNRNSELFEHKPFWVIADYLAKNGIATLRLDDRGIGGSTGLKLSNTSVDFATDISAAVDFLASKGYKNIGLIGHSEGGLIAPMVGQMNKKVKSMILLAAPAIPIIDLMELQVYKVNISGGMPDFQAKIAASASRKLYDYLVNYSGNDLEKDVSKEVKKVSPLLKEGDLKAQVAQLTSPWYRYFLAFKPDEYLSKTKVPVLAINGDLDVQVTSKENLEAIKNSLTKAKNKKFEIVEMEGLNHLFQTAKTGGIAEYEEIEESFSPKVLETMKNWILKK